MRLADKIKELAQRLPSIQDRLKTEEGTKTALVMPFISALGYDVFNPAEVTPELIADVGTKQGEKVDYAIMKNGEAVILIECKSIDADLTDRRVASQLYRYFTSTKARFGVLTNGVLYHFFTDLVAKNRMDDVPFFTFNLSNFSDEDINNLQQFAKGVFDEETNLDFASNLRYRSAIKSYLERIFHEPDDNFITYCIREANAYEGNIVSSVRDMFRDIIREALRTVIRDRVNSRLQDALASTNKTQEVEVPEEHEEATPDRDSRIETTQEEIDAYHIIKAIVCNIIDPDRVFMRDVISYCNILVDNNNRRNICRLYFDREQKYIVILDDERNEQRYDIDGINDLYKYADYLRDSTQRYV